MNQLSTNIPNYASYEDIPAFSEMSDEEVVEKSRKSFDWSAIFSRRASKRSLLLVFRQLALLVETGIDVAEAIELVASSCRQASLQESLLTILDDIRNGNGLGVAVAEQESVLGYQVVASIQAGEASGRLVEVLRQIAAQLEEDLKIRAAIVASLAYPGILCAASVVVAAILVWFVLPQFEGSFLAMGVTPPIFTKILFAIAGFVRGNVLLLVPAVVLGGFLLAFLSVQPHVKLFFYNLCFRSPLIGPTLRNLSVGQLFLSIGHLIGNGISLLEAIQLVKKSNRGGALGALVEAWEHDVLEGRGLTHSVHEFSFMPEGSCAMLVMAERTGKLENVLTTAGAYYRDEGSAKLRQVLKLSEPIIIILLGVFVGVVVASVLLPILDVQAGAAG